MWSCATIDAAHAQRYGDLLLGVSSDPYSDKCMTSPFMFISNEHVVQHEFLHEKKNALSRYLSLFHLQKIYPQRDG